MLIEIRREYVERLREIARAGHRPIKYQIEMIVHQALEAARREVPAGTEELASAEPADDETISESHDC
jgi:hypothetical protein